MTCRDALSVGRRLVARGTDAGGTEQDETSAVESACGASRVTHPMSREGRRRVVPRGECPMNPPTTRP